jgi:hypothetical protein
MTTTTSISLIELSKKILAKELPLIPIDLDLFFEQDSHGNWVIDSETRIQVREDEVNTDFIDKKVQYVLNTNDESDLDILVVVQMPDKSLKLFGGAHTASIKMELGHVASDAIILDFEKDLGGSMAYLKILGNLLNKPSKEQQPYTNDDVKNCLYEFMAEKEQNGLDPKPTDEEINWFVSMFPDVSRKSLGQYISNTSAGGRHQANKTYSSQQLKNIAKAYTDMEEFTGYTIAGPYDLSHAQDSVLGLALRKMIDEKTRKVVILLYCKNMAQQNMWVDKNGNATTRRSNILNTYNNISKYFDIQIVWKMVKYK